ncbi:hypothetical protein ABE237_27910 [Brevibacillus formosus]|uniref:hypothetical protein n=1 Tax=Brevibacillus TaxID=55080 RepID=UPI000D0E5880|nr:MULTISPECIES: hypothetical protein [Brevibacillus]MBG9942853.1 hypothetical protein [Brevibacillus formosus]MED1945683.1 hypothetical protein [Brevibacillus formosus]MED2000684.1 hypothetical protein [Brevibacillus formosus]MED2084470.1 hypothetical protein [Brevibacillus formosus]PSK15656.1 hypothetical protein C7R94_19655 [Brevibacillus sp. NRRL NRS-603]
MGLSRSERNEDRRDARLERRQQALAAQQAKAQENAKKQTSASSKSKSNSVQQTSHPQPSNSVRQTSNSQSSSSNVSKPPTTTNNIIVDKIEISEAARNAFKSSAQQSSVRTESTAIKEKLHQATVEVPRNDTVRISEAAKKALLNEQTLRSSSANIVKSSNDDKKLPKDIQREIKHLQEMYSITTDKEVKSGLNKLANNFRSIGKSKDHYSVLRINTFIPYDKVPLTPIQYYGGDNRSFNYKSTAVRTSQIILINTSKDKVYSANYIGKTHQYDEDGNLTGAELLKLKNASMKVEDSKKGGKVNIVATTSAANPMVEFAPPIDYRMEFNVTKNSVTLVKGEEEYDIETGADIKRSKGSVIDGFPAYEVYGNIDGSGYQTLYKYEPDHWTDIIYKLVDGPGDVELPGTTIKKK